jgi:hypothetical protein
MCAYSPRRTDQKLLYPVSAGDVCLLSQENRPEAAVPNFIATVFGFLAPSSHRMFMPKAVAIKLPLVSKRSEFVHAILPVLPVDV